MRTRTLDLLLLLMFGTLLSKSLMMLPFCDHFYRVSHQQSNSNKFKNFKTFEYYGIRIETFEFPIPRNEKAKL